MFLYFLYLFLKFVSKLESRADVAALSKSQSDCEFVLYRIREIERESHTHFRIDAFGLEKVRAGCSQKNFKFRNAEKKNHLRFAKFFLSSELIFLSKKKKNLRGSFFFFESSLETFLNPCRLQTSSLYGDVADPSLNGTFFCYKTLCV